MFKRFIIRLLNIHFGWDSDGDLCLSVAGVVFAFYKGPEPVIMLGSRLERCNGDEWSRVRVVGWERKWKAEHERDRSFDWYVDKRRG